MSNLGPIFPIILCLLLAVPAPSLAAGSGAFNLFASDAEAVGKGSAFVAEADNASAVYYNPAGLTQLKGKNHMSIGSAVVQPMVDHTSASGVETQMRRSTFLVPHVYFVSDFGLDRVVFGIGAKSNFGAGTEWAEDSFSRYVATKTEITNMDYLVTAAYAVNDRLSFGVGLDWTKSELNQNKNVNQLPGSDGEAQIKATDSAPSFTASTLYKINERHQVGLQYKGRTRLNYNGKVHMTNLNDLGTTPFATIFGGATYTTDADLTFHLPQSLSAGYSYRPDEKWIFNLELEWMDWSSIEQEKITFDSETSSTRLTVLDAATSLPLDWNSTFSIAGGTEYALNDRLRLRGGYFFHQTPIPEANFNTFLSDADSHGINVGFGYDIRQDLTLDMAYTGMLFNDRDIDNSVGVSSGASIDGNYEEFINMVTMTLSWGF